MSLMELSERRKHDRRAIVRLCKVRDRRTASYASGETADYSSGGALIRVDRARPFGPGDEVDLVVSWDGSALVSADSLVRGRVRRVTPIDHHHQAVAVEFVREAAVGAALAA
jgi:hypothetical protein